MRNTRRSPVRVRLSPSLFLLSCVLPLAGARAQTRTATPMRSLMIEASGGTLGSLAGTTVGLAVFRVDQCPVEDDVVCVLRRLSLTGVTSVIGASAGVMVLGRSRDTDPSFGGAVIGSIAGAAAGVAVLS